MENFNIKCASCQNELAVCGLLIESYQGPLVCCDVCRRLYYVDVVVNYENKSVLVIQPTSFTEEEEFQLIRTAVSRIPLSEYLAGKENSENKWGDYKKDDENINPHFDKNLKSIIEESVTPSDLIRKIQTND